MVVVVVWLAACAPGLASHGGSCAHHRAQRYPPHRSAVPTAGPSFFDRLRYGSQGPPAPKAADDDATAPPVGLQPFFDQLDADKNGGLDRAELKRALMLVGIRNVDFDESFKQLDVDGDGLVTFEEFETALPDSIRFAIDERLNDEGRLDSLYLPPEQWREEQSQKEIEWEQRVQMQARRSGNALRQNDILRNELGKQ